MVQTIQRPSCHYRVVDHYLSNPCIPDVLCTWMVATQGRSSPCLLYGILSSSISTHPSCCLGDILGILIQHARLQWQQSGKPRVGRLSDTCIICPFIGRVTLHEGATPPFAPRHVTSSCRLLNKRLSFSAPKWLPGWAEGMVLRYRSVWRQTDNQKNTPPPPLDPPLSTRDFHWSWFGQTRTKWSHGRVASYPEVT